ncbi:MAG: NHL repeat-containing protein [Thermoguttaceae bacterium]|nr:NHL repeat-containing protein [Thermoguttaceae bacterium]MDW8078581.1 NHL repeat-containing protein [Thermoguttaceae bacterium]
MEEVPVLTENLFLQTDRSGKVFTCRGHHGLSFRAVLFSMVILIALPCAASLGAELIYPLSAVQAPDGSVYVADLHLPGISMIRGGNVSVFFQASKKYRTPLNAVRAVTLDAKGALLAADTATSTVYRFEGTEPRALSERGLWTPMDIAVDQSGNIFVSDLGTHRIWVLRNGQGPPELVTEIRAPRGLAIDSQGTLWTVAHGEHQLWRIVNGKPVPVVQGRPFQFPHDVAFDSAGNAYVTDGYASAIWKVTSAGAVEAWVSGKPLHRPVSIAAIADGFIVADPWAKNVFRISLSKEVVPLVSAGQ